MAKETWVIAGETVSRHFDIRKELAAVLLALVGLAFLVGYALNLMNSDLKCSGMPGCQQ